MNAFARHSIKAVCLDAAGTLFRPRGSVGGIYARFARAHGLPATAGLAGELERRFREQFAAMPPPAYRPDAPAHNQAVDRLWWREIVTAVMGDPGPGDFEAFFDAVFDAFADPALWELYPGTLDVLDRLRAGGLRLAIISNFDARLMSICRGLRLGERVEAIVYSSGVGAAKPDARIFRHALARLGVPAAAALHVGDSLRADVEGARAAGLQAIHLHRDAPAPVRQHAGGWPSIGDLRELPALLLPARADDATGP